MNKNMRFLLQLLGASALTITASATAVACNNGGQKSPDISTGVKITNLSIAANTAQTYQTLNTDTNITDAVSSAISTAKNINVVAGTDFNITNDQNPAVNQNIGQTVAFNVAAIGSQITGSFSFNVTLSRPDISNGVNISDLAIALIPNQTYSTLNTNTTVVNAVVAAINTSKNTNITTSDVDIINDQDASALQQAGQKVQFTVNADSAGSQITGSFQFFGIVGKADISNGITVPDLQTGANPALTYSALNTNFDIVNTVVNAINNTLGINITSKDITLTNDQIPTAVQAVSQVVTFTVAASSSTLQITGSFTFTDTLGKISISKGVKVGDLQTAANSTLTYGSLNTNANILAAVVSAINTAKGTNVTANDFTLTNNQTATNNQGVGTIVTFTVTANSSSALTGSFTFVDTLTKISINTGVTIADLQTGANTNTTYGSLNTNTAILAAVVAAINTAKGININANDIVLTNDQTASALQVIGQKVTFTVTGVRNFITGSFTFVNTLSKANISTGVTVPNLQTLPVSTSTYSSLNTNSTILAAVVNAINAAKNTTITTSDITLTNDQTATANQTPNTTVTFTVTANVTSSQIAGSFTFTNTLSKYSISNVTLTNPATVITNITYGALNNNTAILSSIVNAINNAKGTTITTSDFTLTNNQPINNTLIGNMPIVMTVTANTSSTQITGSFSFTNTIAKATNSSDINLGQINQPTDTTRIYGDITGYPGILGIVANAINTQRNVNVSPISGVDFTLYLSSATTTAYQRSGIYVSVYLQTATNSNWLNPSFSIGFTVYFT